MYCEFFSAKRTLLVLFKTMNWYLIFLYKCFAALVTFVTVFFLCNNPVFAIHSPLAARGNSLCSPALTKSGLDKVILHRHCTLYTAHCTLYTLHSTLYNVHCTIYTVYSRLYTVCCTLHTVHTTLYTLHQGSRQSEAVQKHDLVRQNCPTKGTYIAKIRLAMFVKFYDFSLGPGP